MLVGLILTAAALSPWPRLMHYVVGSEAGLVEIITVVAALIGGVAALRIAAAWRRLPSPWLAVWFLLFGLGLFLLAGEEASWGQHWLRFTTPDDWAANNLQQETNLHNGSLATERIPKSLFSIGVLITGVIWPIVYARTGRLSPPLGRFGLIWPDPRLASAALIAVTLRLLERTTVWVDLEDGAWRPWYVAHKESIELFMVLFVVFHLWDVLRRVHGAAGEMAVAYPDRQHDPRPTLPLGV